MPWIESHDDVWEHHKTIKLCQALDIGLVQAVGHLTSIWHFVLRNAWRDANLEAWGDDGIERAARWEGTKGRFVKAMRIAGYLDHHVVHGWLERAGKLVNDRLYNENRKKNAAYTNINGVIRRKTDATLPNPTLPNHTKRTKTAPPKASRAFVPPSLDEIKAYCSERRNGVDAGKWLDHYTANGWKVGRNPMKDWRASVRTWEEGLAAPRIAQEPRKPPCEWCRKVKPLNRYQGGPDLCSSCFKDAEVQSALHKPEVPSA